MTLSKNIGNYKKNLNLISTIQITKGNKNHNKVKKLSKNLYKFNASDKNFNLDAYFVSYKKNFDEGLEVNSKIEFDRKIFNSERILIIGGSSGLGKKLVIYFLLKNLNVDFTYNNNFKSAQNIVKRFNLKKNRFFKFNEKKNHVLKKKIHKYKYIYFFPTAKIFNFSEKYFDYKRFKDLNLLNIHFILKIVELMSLSNKKFYLYVPSTKLIENLGDNIEYTLSKLLQEKILKNINKTYKNIKILNPRLDSYLTNSTKGLINNKSNYDNFIKSAIDF